MKLLPVNTVYSVYAHKSREKLSIFQNLMLDFAGEQWYNVHIKKEGVEIMFAFYAGAIVIAVAAIGISLAVSAIFSR